MPIFDPAANVPVSSLPKGTQNLISSLHLNLPTGPSGPVLNLTSLGKTDLQAAVRIGQSIVSEVLDATQITQKAPYGPNPNITAAGRG